MVNVFISHPTPHNNHQEQFLSLLANLLKNHDLYPVNLGHNNWNFQSPLKPISEIINTCKAAVIVGLERSHSYIDYEKEYSNISTEQVSKYTSSPWGNRDAGKE